MTVTIYHNPNCSTSRNALAMIRDKGIEPVVVQYLKTPPDRATLKSLAAAAGGVRVMLRAKEKLAGELGLTDPAVDDDAVLDAMLTHPVLIERPIVVAPGGVRVCRPLDKLTEIL